MKCVAKPGKSLVDHGRSAENARITSMTVDVATKGCFAARCITMAIGRTAKNFLNPAAFAGAMVVESAEVVGGPMEFFVKVTRGGLTTGPVTFMSDALAIKIRLGPAPPVKDEAAEPEMNFRTNRG